MCSSDLDIDTNKLEKRLSKTPNFYGVNSLRENNNKTPPKAFYKKYASKEGLEKFSLSSPQKVDNFRDYQPLLFIGNTTLHTNYPVSSSCASYRLTLLAHFFDPSPKYGVGGLLRLLRNR